MDAVERVLYADIPTGARDVLDELYLPEGVEIWWNSPNRLLFNFLDADDPARINTPLIPRDHPEAAEGYANSLADGNFL